MRRSILVMLLVVLCMSHYGCGRRRVRARMVRHAATRDARLRELETQVALMQTTPAPAVVEPAAATVIEAPSTLPSP
ncbi:MAG: hypothetical protein AAGA92_14620 [Planctomycetota bacterium]